MMDRLTRRINDEIKLDNKHEICGKMEQAPIVLAMKKLADYEDAEETGLLIHLPRQDAPLYDPRFGEIDVYLFSGIIWECKQIGVWGYRTDGRDEVTKICKFYELGETVFLTREEAENALRENING